MNNLTSISLVEPVLRCRVPFQVGGSKVLASGPVPLARVWGELCAGRYRIADHHCTSSHACLVLEPLALATRFKSEESELLQRVLQGESRKRLAELGGRSYSAINRTLGSCLQALGLKLAPSRVPLGAVLAAQASPRVQTREAQLSVHADNVHILRTKRPDHDLGAEIPAACAFIARALVQGKDRRQIAEERGTSMATVSNQVSSTFRHFGVSGRYELIWQLNTMGAYDHVS